MRECDPFGDARRSARQGEYLKSLLAQAGDCAQEQRWAYQVGMLNLDMGEHTKAVHFLSKAVELGPPCAEVYTGLGQACLEAGETHTAIAEFENALRIAPRCIEAHAGLEIAWCALGEPRKGVLHADIFGEEKYGGAKSVECPSQPASVLCTSLPKSGSTFLFYVLCQTLGLSDKRIGIQSHKDHLDFHVVASLLKYFALGGGISHDHIPATAENLQLMLSLWPTKIWVHVRDPRDAATSAYHQLLGEGQGCGELRERRLHKLSIQRAHIAAMGYANEEGLREFVQTVTLDRFTDFIAKWLNAADQYPDRIFVTRFEDLVMDGKAFFARIERTLGVCGGALTCVDLNPDFPKNRFRSGRIGEWREFFSRSSAISVDNLRLRSVLDRLGYSTE
jgi:tetratricopeptide (TPR) repeat protein